MSSESAKGKSGDLERDRFPPSSEGKGDSGKASYVLTTNQGVTVTDDLNSLKVGPRGPTLLEDFHFREKIQHFDHERIPERVVHARGSGAHGYFECTESASDITVASLFQEAGSRTPLFVRFSTVQGSKGSIDTPRDVRGFAIKFYTSTGAWDLVCNNIPVFFIHDALKFPDLVHALKPEPHNEIPQAASAHDTFWDFVSLTPESAHMLMWAMSDRTLPRSFAHIQGFGVHTFRFINGAGESHLVKFHIKPVKGICSTTWDEAQKIGGKNPDYHRQELWEAIERKDYPEYSFGVQVIREGSEEEKALGIDLLDPTKIIPEEVLPVRILGKIVLNRNPDNFFCETEQIAFCPAHVINGVDFTNDPLLQGRLFSYLDTQITRVGPNFVELPINRPVCPFANHQRNGFMRHRIDKGRVAYWPNTLAGGHPGPSEMTDKGAFRTFPAVETGQKVRVRGLDDHFSQATMFWNSMTDWEKAHIVAAYSFELNCVKTISVRENVVNNLLVNIHPVLAEAVARRIGVKITAPMVEPHDKASPALSMDRKLTPDQLAGRKIAIIISSRSSADEVKAFRKVLESHKILSETVALTRDEHEELKVDTPFPNAASCLYDGAYVVGDAAKDLLCWHGAVAFVTDQYVHGKPIACSGGADDGRDLLDAAGVPRNERKAEDPTVSGILQTTSKPGKEFFDSYIQIMCCHRFPYRQPETKYGGDVK